MTQQDQSLLADVALHVPAAALVAYGAFEWVNGRDPTAAVGTALAWLGLLYSQRAILIARQARKEQIAEQRAAEAPTMHFSPGVVGAIVTSRFLCANSTPEQWEAAKDIFGSVTNLRVLSDSEKHVFGYPKHAMVFATRQSFVSINLEPNINPDLVRLSARGALLQDDATKTMPLVKPAAIRMALLLGQYQNFEEAVRIWDSIYNETRGRQLIEDAYRKVGHDIGALISDGPIALLDRHSRVFSYGGYRYLAIDNIEGVDTEHDVQRVISAIVKRGVYDVDKRQFVQLASKEREWLAKRLSEEGRALIHAVNSSDHRERNEDNALHQSR